MSAVTKPPLPLVHADTKMYVLCVVHTGPENRKRNKTICDFRREKSWNIDVRIPETPPPPLSANLLPPPSPPECGRLLWTASNDKLRGYNDYLTIAKTMYTRTRSHESSLRRTLHIKRLVGKFKQRNVLYQYHCNKAYRTSVPYFLAKV